MKLKVSPIPPLFMGGATLNIGVIMTTNLIPFSFESHEIRVVMQDGDPWWIAMDVAQVLEYSDTEAMTRRLDDDEIQNLQIVGFGPRGVTVINESGLYSAIFGSRKPEAKKFKKWNTSEVLPSIRKTGSYALPGVDQPIYLRKEYKQLHDLMIKLDRTRCPFARLTLVNLARPLFKTLDIPMPSTDLIERAVHAEKALHQDPDWRRILLVIVQEIDKKRYVYPYAHRHIDGVDCLVLRTSHIMEYLSQSKHLAAFWKSLWLRSDRVLKRQLIKAGLVVRLRHNPSIDHFQFHHAVAVNLQALHGQPTVI